jgi:hypothetical protein
MKIKSLILVFITSICFSQNKIDFNTYNLKGTGLISIPTSLEKQDGEYKKLSEKAQKDIGEKVTEDRVVFQKQGRNDAYKDKSPSYEKIIFETHIGIKGDFKKINSIATTKELKDINDDSYNTFQSEMEIYKTKINIKLLSWTKASNVKINNKNAIKLSYVRQINDNEPSVVDVYFFVNNDRYHKITITYRLEKSLEWKPIFEKVINSFTITNIR